MEKTFLPLSIDGSLLFPMLNLAIWVFRLGQDYATLSVNEH